MNAIPRTRMLNESFKRFQRLPNWPLDNLKPVGASPLADDGAGIIELHVPVQEPPEEPAPEPVPVRCD